MDGVRVAADGVHLWVEDTGAGATVLFISGLGYSNWCWAEAVAALTTATPSFRAITFDNRGAGRSDAPEEGYSIVRFADDAAAVIEHAKARPVDVVGHSMGGYIALTLAARHPALVRSLVLIGTSSGGTGNLPIPIATSDAWKASVKLPPHDFAKATMPYSFATGWSHAHPQRFKELLAARLAFPTATEPWKKQFRAASDFGRDGLDVSRLGLRSLVIHGTDDRVVPYANGQRLAGQLPNATLDTWEGAGHLCYLEDPARFHARLLAWLAS